MLVIRSTVLATFVLSSLAVPIGDTREETAFGQYITITGHGYPPAEVPDEHSVHTLENLQCHSGIAGSYNFSSSSVPSCLLPSSNVQSELSSRADTQTQSSIISVALTMKANKLTRYGTMRIGDGTPVSAPPQSNALKISDLVPYQALPMAFDTASLLSMVPGPKCTGGCIGNQRYDPIRSTTARVVVQSFDTNRRRYGLAGGTGSLVSVDQAYLQKSQDGSAPTNVPVRHGFALAEKYSSRLSKAASFSPAGIVNMGYYKPDRAQQNLRSLPIELWRSRAIDSPEFTFLPLESSSDDSRLIFGKFGNPPPPNAINQVVGNNDGFWRIVCEWVFMGPTVLGRRTDAVISTGDPFIRLPSIAVQTLYAQITKTNPQAQAGVDGRWRVPCNGKYPKITVVLGKLGLDLRPEWFAIPTGNSNECLGAVVASEGAMTIGDVLLRRYRVRFDLAAGTVSFGQ